MSVSIFDLYSIGIGPSSSHTVGPMRAAYTFLNQQEEALLAKADQLVIHLYGSLSLTGKGHATDKAVVYGALGYQPQTIDIQAAEQARQAINENEMIQLLGKYQVAFNLNDAIVFHNEALPEHANGMRFVLYQAQQVLVEQTFFSIGGGFILSAEAMAENDPKPANIVEVPYEFSTAKELLALTQEHDLTIPQLMWHNEISQRSPEEVKSQIMAIWHVMDDSIQRGQTHRGILPGGLEVKRRAASMTERLMADKVGYHDMNWMNMFAIAVNEENAAGQKVVTAPTNGSAGVIPAVMKYYLVNNPSDEQTIIDFMLTTAAIGILYKKGASISAAEVGCQGEIGVASSMAAAGYAALYGANALQIANAAEIAMEHSLGMTCDPIKGLVQIPCIERNTMGAMRAVNSAKLALLGDGTHVVPLDSVIKTMMQTGQDMSTRYKETAQAGLAVNLPAC